MSRGLSKLISAPLRQQDGVTKPVVRARSQPRLVVLCKTRLDRQLNGHTSVKIEIVDPYKPELLQSSPRVVRCSKRELIRQESNALIGVHPVRVVAAARRRADLSTERWPASTFRWIVAFTLNGRASRQAWDSHSISQNRQHHDAPPSSTPTCSSWSRRTTSPSLPPGRSLNGRAHRRSRKIAIHCSSGQVPTRVGGW
jgi:hypothetical protein